MSAVIFYSQTFWATAYCRAFLHLYYTQPPGICQAVFSLTKYVEYAKIQTGSA